MASSLELGILRSDGRTARIVDTHRLNLDDVSPLQTISLELLRHYQVCEALLYAWCVEYLKQTP